MTFAYALSFDLYIPPYEIQDEISVNQMHYMGETLKLQTGKRLGFKMRSEDTDIS
jgi:nitrogen fixation protein